MLEPYCCDYAFAANASWQCLQAMESDNLVWLLLGMLLAIGGALFMGCAAFISEQHAMISHVIVLEDPLHPPAGLGTGGVFPLHNGGSSAPAPTSQSDWQHNMAALEERVRAGDAGRCALPSHMPIFAWILVFYMMY